MVVLVTGAANGLGAGIVEALLALGARVALADVDEPAMTATRARLDPSGARTVGVVADVTDEPAVGRFVSAASSRAARRRRANSSRREPAAPS